MSIEPENYEIINTDSSEEEIIFSYDVKWERVPISWSNRWNIIGNAKTFVTIDEFIIPILIIICLTAVVLFILIKTVNKNNQTLEVEEETSGRNICIYINLDCYCRS